MAMHNCRASEPESHHLSCIWLVSLKRMHMVLHSCHLDSVLLVPLKSVHMVVHHLGSVCLVQLERVHMVQYSGHLDDETVPVIHLCRWNIGDH